MLTGFSPRKQNISLYLMCGLTNFSDLLKNLGKYKTSVSCVYINKLDDVNLNKLEILIGASIDKTKNLYG